MLKAKKLALSLLASACMLASGFGIYNAIGVQAETNQAAAYWEGFAITGVAIRTDAPAGLRFKTDVERLTPTMKKYNPDAEYYTVLTLTTEGKEYTTTRYTDVWRPDGSGWNTVLLDIPESDYETQVTAQSFVKLNGRETAVYQTKPVTVSIAQTAALALSYGITDDYITQYVDDIVTSVSLDQTSKILEIGQTLQLTATTTPRGYAAKFTTDNPDVATVDVKGKVTAKAVGSATITAEINGQTATCQVEIEERNAMITGFASSATIKNSNKKITISGDWLNNTFSDERLDAVTFTATSPKTMNLTSGRYQVALTANEGKRITLTRSMYDAWKLLGETNLTITSDYDFGWNILSSVEIGFDNFQKVWAEDASTELTEEEIALLQGIPDYSYNTQKYDFFGYSSLTDGSWEEYDIETGEHTEHQAAEDYRNVYRIAEYKEAGMTILFPQTACEIVAELGEGFVFEGSKLKEVMDMAVEAGLGKVILCDRRLYALVVENDSLVGENKRFATEAELDAQIKRYMKDYVQHPAFYGVMLLDEPAYTMLTAQGEVYRAIKRCYPNAYVQCNLNPPNNHIEDKFGLPDSNTVAKYRALGYNETLAERYAAYDKYLNTFLDNTGADYIMYDYYPFWASELNADYLAGMQLTANICLERGVKFYFVSQTTTIQGKTTGINSTYTTALTEADLRWLNNMQLGFGVKQIGYFTYFTKQAASAAERFVDGASFITHDGEKTDIYYAMRKILQENQAFASTILSFDYTASATYIADGMAHDVSNAQNCLNGAFAKVGNISVNTESALVTELYDEVNKRYMYMLQNITDPREKSDGTLQTIKLAFNGDYEYAIVWKNGQKSIVRLENNTYIVKQNAGEAVYVIPFNQGEGGFVIDHGNGDNGVWFPGSSNGQTQYSK